MRNHQRRRSRIPRIQSRGSTGILPMSGIAKMRECVVPTFDIHDRRDAVYFAFAIVLDKLRIWYTLKNIIATMCGPLTLFAGSFAGGALSQALTLAARKTISASVFTLRT